MLQSCIPEAPSGIRYGYLLLTVLEGKTLDILSHITAASGDDYKFSEGSTHGGQQKHTGVGAIRCRVA